ncbi:MAG: TIGR03545 family protein [Treponema sp.]|nr:TIGR03545 family protein [Treponema sp.]
MDKELEKKSVSEKEVGKKTPKTLPMKKAPKMFKKTYREKKFKKKILKKIYIPSDLALVKSVYSLETDAKGRKIYVNNLDRKLETAKIKRLKVVAKQIKKNKKGIRVLPLIITAAVLAFVFTVVLTFKNVVVKKGIVYGMQKVFQAKTDVQKVDVSFLDSYIKINGLAQANKDSPMTNIFQIDEINLDFNLTELLKGKFYAEKIAVEGVAIGTERKTSGELPASVKKEKTKESELNKQMKVAQEKLTVAAQNELRSMFDKFNPENILSDMQYSLKSPELAKTLTKDVQEKVEKWAAVPGQIEKDYNEFSKSVATVLNTDWNNITDLVQIKNTIDAITKSINDGKALSETVNHTINEVKADSMLVKTYGEQVAQAVTEDATLVDNKIKEIKALYSVDGVRKVMNDSVESLIYQLSGKYYPYVQKALETAKSIQAKPKEPKKEKKASIERLKGRNIYYKKDTVPKLRIDEVAASGYEKGTNSLLFSGSVKNISSDQNMTGKPSLINADFKVMGHPNKAAVVVDVRDNSTAPMVSADYDGKDWIINADAGAFALKSTSEIMAKLSAENDGSFSLGGTLDMAVSEMTGMDLGNEMVNRVYQKALAKVDRLTIGFTCYKEKDDYLKVRLDNPELLGKQLSEPVIKAFTEEVEIFVNEAKERVKALLSERTNGLSDQLLKFSSMEELLNAQKNNLAALEKQLEEKRNELEARVKAQATEKINQVAEESKKQMEAQAKETMKDVGNNLKGLFR